MELEKSKFNLVRLLVVVGFVVITAVAVGGSTYYVMSVQSKKEKEEFETQIKSLEKRVAEVAKKDDVKQPVKEEEMESPSVETETNKIFRDQGCNVSLNTPQSVTWTVTGPQNAWTTKAVFNKAGKKIMEYTCSNGNIGQVKSTREKTVGSYTYKVSTLPGVYDEYYLSSENNHLIVFRNENSVDTEFIDLLKTVNIY